MNDEPSLTVSRRLETSASSPERTTVAQSRASHHTRQLGGEHAADPARRGHTPLSTRELEVLHLMAEGLSIDEIASALEISQETVKTYLSRILAKLKLRDRLQAVMYAYREGMLT
ncbi:response regulator transcription factor [Phytohabitans kaempferiae]|uniref:Response regulator transcription factor n=1 Tax=Phytohabitans kaempferiae TaxID=1620943 RepID=A0ABV6MCB8_9ACTN